MFADSTTGKTMGIPVRSEPEQSRGLFQDNAKHSPAPRDNFPSYPEWIGTTSAPRWYKSPRPPVNTPTSFYPLRAQSSESALDSFARRSYMFSEMSSRLHRKSLRPFSFLLAALLAALSCVSATAQDHTLSPEKRAQIEKAVSAFMTANSVPGVSVAVVQSGQPVWSTGFGMSALQDSAPAHSFTLY